MLPASLILPPVSVAVVPTVFKASLSRWVSASMPGGSQNPEDAEAVCAVGSDVPPALDMASAIWPAAEAIAFICATAPSAWLFQLSSAAPKVCEGRAGGLQRIIQALKRAQGVFDTEAEFIDDLVGHEAPR